MWKPWLARITRATPKLPFVAGDRDCICETLGVQLDRRIKSVGEENRRLAVPQQPRAEAHGDIGAEGNWPSSAASCPQS
ncbi:hypothetical protein GCM10010095_21310 [Streptomyces anthocyanicus]|nr:hypothetical protein GCM10010095_21310 [Streptomyces anthocyanicus]